MTLSRLILRELHASDPPRNGALGMLLAFGPGLTCEMALLRARGWLADRPAAGG